ncbi:MAG: autotransporter-associated beta strand repeat-containing protein [Kiritimatiellia bacterium]
MNNGDERYSIWHEGNGLIEGAGTLRLGCGVAGEPARLYIKNDSTLTIQAPLTSSGGLEMYHSYGGGTLVLDCLNTMASDMVISSTSGKLSVSQIGNRGSIDSNVGQGDRILLTGLNASLIYTGAGEITDRIIEFSNNVALDHSGSGDLTLTEDLVASAAGKTLTLTGSAAGAGEIAGVIGTTANTTALVKDGTGVWRLSNGNAFTGKTTLKQGALALCGANGALMSTASIAIEGGTLCISNTAAANLLDRVNDAAAITLKGGAIEFTHDSAASTDYSESLGALTVADYAGAIKVSQAAEGCTSTLTFASIANSGNGSVNFVGQGLGEEGSGRSRIFFTTPPLLENGLIPWAVVNGSAVATYDETRGVYALSTGIAARGPNSVIPDNSSLNVQISTDGVEGPITLESPSGASIVSLTQASDTPAVVAMAGQTLQSYVINIAEDAAALTIGQVAGDSTLQISSGYENFGVINRSTNALTVNAQTVESVSGTGLSKSGKGAVTLNGQLNVAGNMVVSDGTLTLAELSNATHLIGNNFEMRGGSVTPVRLWLNGAAEVVDNGEFRAGMKAGDRCIVEIDNNLVIQATPAPERKGGKMLVGMGQDAAGAVIQRSGTLSISTNISGTAFYVIGGTGGYGYHRITGGTLASGEITVGNSSGGSFGNSSVLDLFGGEVMIEGWCVLVAWGKGEGALNLFGGTMASPGTLGTEAIILAYNVSSDITAQVNMLGPNARMFDSGPFAKKRILMANRDGNTICAFNLNDGELTLHNAYTKSVTTPTHFNFNGGLLKAAHNSMMMSGLTAAHVFAGGARIDTDGYDASLEQALVAPQGHGVADIELTSSGAGYIGPPTVIVTGGSGIGATAIALVDLEDGSPSCGQVTNIMVTSAGSGYAANDTLIATLRGGGSLTLATLGAVTLAPNVSGGLTKLGAGSLTLGAPCTFSGGTLVSTGTLEFGCDDALLPGSSVTLEEGTTLDLNGFTSSNVVDGAGVVVNGSLSGFSPAGENVIGTQVLSIGNDLTLSGTYTLDLTLEGASDQLVITGDADLSGVQLQVVDLDQLNRRKSYAVASVTGQVQALFNAGNLPDERWRLKRVNNTVLLFFADGMQLILR